MASTRRLTAILAADVAGYSRLMGVDEEGTHERLKAHLRELIDPKIEEHRGHIVKNTGDGMLAEFASVVDAVRCAAQVQRGMIDREPEVPNERQIKFRIGVNLGDVIADGGDIFGDGVNVAARLEALAEPGGICVSRVVRYQVRDKLPYSFEDRGEQNVKNIARPVRVYALLPEAVAELPVAGVPIAVPRHRPSAIAAMAVAVTAVLVIAVIAWWVWPTMRSSPTPPAAVSAAATSIAQPLVAPRLSIIVLPFTNLSNDPEQQYFADAVTEDLTTDLSRIGHMFVISRNTAFTYRNKPVDGKQIGHDLGVRYVLEGSVQRSGNQVRVNAQLINAETDAHLWAERFDRDIGDLFALQSEITGRIAKALGVALITREAARPTEHPDALDYILRGSAAGLKPNSRDVSAEAISLFEHALTLNPRSVEAQTLLANSLVGRVRDQMTDSAAADLARAEGLVDQALAAASRNAFAHLVKGRVLQAQNRWEEAVLEFEATLGSDSNSVWALHYLAMSKLFTGSIEEVIPLEEQAIRLSPREPRIGWWYYAIGTVHLLQSRTDEAIVWLEKARSAIPAAPVFRSHLASAYALRSETERAAAELAEARRLVGDDRYSSIAHLQAVGYFGVPKIRVLFEATYLAGLRKAGMPED
jgi:adenylate cyclase